ncbi:hypothetical protein [uncultured Thiodictyon sp.]|uniref:hypothetical protein n=1 Tax=uncultured Thiodictyon sp. TaxID=1846217 RepID=UPI0025ED74FB|nr:hypothetical protein [uncultured Thiodictyon sp.]
MRNIEQLLSEYEMAVTSLENLAKFSADCLLAEEKLRSILGLMENCVADKDIPLLITPLEFIGGPVVPPAVVRTIGTIRSSNAFDAILRILKECFEGGRSEEATANECVKALDEIDSERAEREGVEDFLESHWF